MQRDAERSGDAQGAKVGDFVGRFSLCVCGECTGGEVNEGDGGGRGRMEG